MRRLYTLVLILILCLVFPNLSLPVVRAVEDYWTTLAPLPTPFYSNLGAAVVDGKIYFIGSHAYVQYDPEINNWTDISPLPIYNDWSTVVACQNKVYVIGGSEDIPTQVYDPSTDTWENRTSIPTTRSSQQAAVVDGKIYVIGGEIPSAYGVVNPSSSNDVYNPETDSWSQMAPIPTPVMGYASAVLDEKIYVISGGHSGGPDYKPINLVQIFDPAMNQWTNGTSIPTGVAYAGACVTIGLSETKRIYLIGGTTFYHPRYGFYSATNLNQIYDPETDLWTIGTPMPTPRGKFGIAVINDEIYAIGGHNSIEWLIVVSANEKYTPNGYIPEFPSWIILPLLLVATLIVTIARNKLIRKGSE